MKPHWQKCFETDTCKGSVMFSGNHCVLFSGVSCSKCPEDAVAVSPTFPSRYVISKARPDRKWDDLSTSWMQRGMHLLAINSQQEQELILDLITQYIKCE